jgi:hypothetical protein
MTDARRLALILATRQEQANGSWAQPESVVARARIYLSFLQEGGSGGSKETVSANETVARARPNLVAISGP